LPDLLAVALTGVERGRVEQNERAELHRWMCRLADGDRSAFHPVFVQAYPALLGLARRILRSGTDAEDAAQAALIKVFSRAADFDGVRDALSWMFALTAYECRTLETARRRKKEQPGVPESSAEETPESAFARRELLSAAQELLGALSPEDSALLEAAWRGDPRPSVAGPTFRKRVQRAVGRLRLAWRMKHGAD
jgi:RNA polymerase sigma factor (sigma-70 family)